jgi:hypothetical protein
MFTETSHLRQNKAVRFQDIDLGKSSVFEQWGFQLELFLQHQFTSIGYSKLQKTLVLRCVHT